MEPRDIPLRAARDRLIDLLGWGDTDPLADLEVPAEKLKVAYDTIAKVEIRDAQIGVGYQLIDPKDKPAGVETPGAGAMLALDTPPVKEDITYRIRALKVSSGRQCFLQRAAPVKVGIDTKILVEIKAEGLERSLGPPRPEHPRLVLYGARVDVEIGAAREGFGPTQAGVQYSLLVDGKDVPGATLPGNRAAITLRTGEMTEDAVIQVRATRTFSAGGTPKTESELLAPAPQLKVMANPTLAVSIDPPVVDYLKDATLKIAATQNGVDYQPWSHVIQDAEYVREAAADLERVPVAGSQGLQVRETARAGGPLPEGYSKFNAAVTGGGDRTTLVNAAAEDVVVVVRAIKKHRVDAADPASRIVESQVWLNQAAVLLVRPDPGRALKLRVPMAGAQTGDGIRFTGGEPGVFYHLPLQTLPAYFHKADPASPAESRENKGVGLLGLGIDFAIAADPEVAPADRARTPPPPPLVAIQPLPAGSSLQVRARKAQTNVEAILARSASIAPVPAMRAEPGKIVVSSSDPQDLYQLALGGNPVGDALAGNGADLELITPAQTADAVFEVIVTRPADKGLPVERVVRVP